MQTIQDLQDKLFFECKQILDTLSKITSSEELVLRHDLITDLSDRIHVLKYLDKNTSNFSSPIRESEPIVVPLDVEEESNSATEEDEIEEEVLFTNELNEIDSNENVDEDQSALVDEFELVEENEFSDEEFVADTEAELVSETLENEVDQKEIEEEEYSQNIIEQEEQTRQEIDQVLKDSEDYQVPMEENEPEIILESTDQEEEIEIDKDLPMENEEQPTVDEAQEKRFKLANIKGMKSVQSLFDDESLAATEKITNKEQETGSLVKSNVSTDFMEAPKPRPEFRLDLNDKIAFSRVLFDGSQSELNDAVRNLNECKTLDEAKEYLSDLYYARNWKKADDVAQRLWTLVETKFH